MSKRIIISVAAAALIAIPAQSASAAISKPVGPAAQEMDHGVAPTFDHGVGTSAPEATESVPSPAEQGVSSSPGVVEPVTEPTIPDSPEATDGDESEDEGGPGSEECLEAVDATETAGKWANTAVDLWQLFGRGSVVGEYFNYQADFLVDVQEDLEQQEEDACTDPEGEEPA